MTRRIRPARSLRTTCLLTTASLASALTLVATSAAADPGDRLDRKGDRIERRLDHKGDRIERQFDRRADRAEANGHPVRARRLEHKGDRIDRRLDRKGERIDRRLDRRADRIERRD